MYPAQNPSTGRAVVGAALGGLAGTLAVSLVTGAAAAIAGKDPAEFIRERGSGYYRLIHGIVAGGVVAGAGIGASLAKGGGATGAMVGSAVAALPVVAINPGPNAGPGPLSGVAWTALVGVGGAALGAGMGARYQGAGQQPALPAAA